MAEKNYKVGDYVVHESSGVCCINSIEDREMMGRGSMQKYYVMTPVYKSTASVFVPVEGAVIRLRDVSSEKEISALFDGISEVDVLVEPNDRQRAELVKETMNKFTLVDLAVVVKTAILRRCIRIEAGKKVMAQDEKVLAVAGKRLYEELAFSLGKEVVEMQEKFEEAVKSGCDESKQKLMM